MCSLLEYYFEFRPINSLDPFSLIGRPSSLVGDFCGGEEGGEGLPRHQHLPRVAVAHSSNGAHAHSWQVNRDISAER